MKAAGLTWVILWRDPFTRVAHYLKLANGPVGDFRTRCGIELRVGRDVITQLPMSAVMTNGCDDCKSALAADLLAIIPQP